MKIIVLAGGLSPEREVSLTTGVNVSNALIDNGHEVMLLDLYYGTKSKIFKPKYHNHFESFRYHYAVKPDIPDFSEIKKQPYLFHKSIIKICQKADMVFLALHGSIGENGMIQALLELYNIKYTGSNFLGSALAMNKHISKELMLANKILTPKYIYYEPNTLLDNVDLSFPVVIKPVASGSSIGIKFINNLGELRDKIKDYDEEIIIEEAIIGREFTVSILNNEVLPIIEIKVLNGFYDYVNKYQANKTIEECPANISNDLKTKLEEISLKVFKILNLKSYARIDFLVDKNNNIYCLEANTLPGMTPTSLLPLSAKENKISFNRLCELILKS